MTSDVSSPDARPAPRRGRALRRLLEIAATVLVTIFIFRRVGIDVEALAALDPGRWSPDPLALTGSVVALAVGYAVSASLWGKMVRELGGPTLPVRITVPLFLVANVGRYVPGKVLQIAGLTWLARGRGVPGPVAAGAAVLGQGVALLGATLIGLAAFFSPALEGTYRIWGWLGLAALGIFLLLTALPAPARALERGWFRLAGTPGDRPALSRAFGLRWTTLYALNWSIYALAFWLLFLGLEGWAPFLYVGPAFAAAYVGGYLAIFAPAGRGVREGLLAAFLAPVLRPEAALAVAVAARIWTTAVEVIPAAALAPRVLAGAGDAGADPTSPGQDTGAGRSDAQGPQTPAAPRPDSRDPATPEGPE